MALQAHRSDPDILRRRTVEFDHPRLVELLRPGLAVLDIGCGPGSITAGIARLVGPNGTVIGVDRDVESVEEARRTYAGAPGLRFKVGDFLDLRFDAEFDIVAAARALQWMPRPAEVLRKMRAATKSGGSVVVFDYNHRRNAWKPRPPLAFRRFHDGFLNWREANGWDNLLGEKFVELLPQAGLTAAAAFDDPAIARRGGPRFETAARVMPTVMETLGPAIVAEGFLTAEESANAMDCVDWFHHEMEEQSLSMSWVRGVA